MIIMWGIQNSSQLHECTFYRQETIFFGAILLSIDEQTTRRIKLQAN